MFFVVRGDNDDNQPIMVDDVVVESCDRYIYLGSPFTADGSVSRQWKFIQKTKCVIIKNMLLLLMKITMLLFMSKSRYFRLLSCQPCCMAVSHSKEVKTN